MIIDGPPSPTSIDQTENRRDADQGKLSDESERKDPAAKKSKRLPLPQRLHEMVGRLQQREVTTSFDQQIEILSAPKLDPNEDPTGLRCYQVALDEVNQEYARRKQQNRSTPNQMPTKMANFLTNTYHEVVAKPLPKFEQSRRGERLTRLFPRRKQEAIMEIHDVLVQHRELQTESINMLVEMVWHEPSNEGYLAGLQPETVTQVQQIIDTTYVQPVLDTLTSGQDTDFPQVFTDLLPVVRYPAAERKVKQHFDVIVRNIRGSLSAPRQTEALKDVSPVIKQAFLVGSELLQPRFADQAHYQELSKAMEWFIHQHTYKTTEVPNADSPSYGEKAVFINRDYYSHDIKEANSYEVVDITQTVPADMASHLVKVVALELSQLPAEMPEYQVATGWAAALIALRALSLDDDFETVHTIVAKMTDLITQNQKTVYAEATRDWNKVNEALVAARLKNTDRVMATARNGLVGDQALSQMTKVKEGIQHVLDRNRSAVEYSLKVMIAQLTPFFNSYEVSFTQKQQLAKNLEKVLSLFDSTTASGEQVGRTVNGDIHLEQLTEEAQRVLLPLFVKAINYQPPAEKMYDVPPSRSQIDQRNFWSEMNNQVFITLRENGFPRSIAEKSYNDFSNQEHGRHAAEFAHQARTKHISPASLALQEKTVQRWLKTGESEQSFEELDEASK